jgi:hypothetical protein
LHVLLASVLIAMCLLLSSVLLASGLLASLLLATVVQLQTKNQTTALLPYRAPAHTTKPRRQTIRQPHSTHRNRRACTNIIKHMQLGKCRYHQFRGNSCTFDRYIALGKNSKTPHKPLVVQLSYLDASRALLFLNLLPVHCCQSSPLPVVRSPLLPVFAPLIPEGGPIHSPCSDTPSIRQTLPSLQDISFSSHTCPGQATYTIDPSY